MPMVDSTAPTGSRRASCGSRDFGHQEPARTRASSDDRDVDEEHRPYQKRPSSQPLTTGPMAPAAPRKLAQMAMALGRSSGGKTLIRIDRVEGMISAPASPMTARQAMSSHMAVREGGQPGRRRRKTTQPELERALAAEAVAERAGGEQAAGEHQRVDGDDPLELRRAWRAGHGRGWAG